MNYPHPPIVEAAIEFRFAGSGNQNDLEAATKKLRSAYPRLEEARPVLVTVQMANAPRASSLSPPPAIRKMTSADGADIVMLQPDSVAAARLAPYRDWEDLEGKFRKNLGAARAIVKKRRLARIGVRFINRIDVAQDELGSFNHRDYLKLGDNLMPLEDAPVLGLMFSVTSLLDRGRFGVIINCGKVDSPLVDHAGLLLDIEVFNQANLPVTDADIWVQVTEIRSWKNRLFEASITDRARAMFQ